MKPSEITATPQDKSGKNLHLVIIPKWWLNHQPYTYSISCVLKIIKDLKGPTCCATTVLFIILLELLICWWQEEGCSANEHVKFFTVV